MVRSSVYPARHCLTDVGLVEAEAGYGSPFSAVCIGRCPTSWLTTRRDFAERDRFDTVTVSRALLQNNATDLRNGVGKAQGDGASSVASINEMGAGHINIAEALIANAIISHRYQSERRDYWSGRESD